MSQHDKQVWARVGKLLTDAATTAGVLLVLTAHLLLPGMPKQQELLQDMVVEKVSLWGGQAALAVWAQARALMREQGAVTRQVRIEVTVSNTCEWRKRPRRQP
jgi:hypothetical protein